MTTRTGSLLILLCLLGACGEASKSVVVEASVGPDTAFGLDTTSIELGNLSEVYPVPGDVVSAREAWIAPRSTGFVEQVTVTEGERVSTGQLLAVIDSTAVEAQIAIAEATLSAATATLLDAEEDVRRFQRLARTQALAEDQLLDAKVRQAQARAAVKKAEADRQTRIDERRYTRLQSPADALVRERLADPGDLATAGKPLLHLDILGALEFELFLPSHRAALLQAGEAVSLSIDGIDRAINGRIERVVRVADPVTRQCKVRIALPQDSRAIPGAFGHARLRLPARPARFLPSLALTRRAGIDGVFVVDADERVRFRSVRIGLAWPNETPGEGIDGHELLAGPPPGSLVVVEPPDRLKDGDRLAKAVAGNAPDE